MELGEIQRRQGDLDAADASLRRCLELGTDPQPGKALVDLDRGNLDGARAGIRRALADGALMVREERTLLLPAAVTIGLAAGDMDDARAAAAELRTLADAWATPATEAAAWRAEGEIALATGDLPDARTRLERAWRLWCDVDAPYEAAQTRALLGRVHLASGDRPAATLELDAARDAFQRLGAQHDATRVAQLLASDRRDVRAAKTLMFTDIVESTRLVEVVGDDAWQDLLAWHDRTLRSCFDQHAGTEVKHEGDGFFVAFDRPDDALACAVTIQQTLAEHRREHGFAPPVRIGVHATEATEVAGDYFGRGVHEAARVASVAGANEIVASAATLAASSGELPVTDRRAVELKGLAAPVELATVTWS
jgi:class 3 adenylate cyclase